MSKHFPVFVYVRKSQRDKYVFRCFFFCIKFYKIAQHPETSLVGTEMFVYVTKIVQNLNYGE